MTTERIVVAKPPIGAKAWVMDRKGRFILEEQPGNLLHLTCTHAGEGGILASDLDGRPLLRLQPSAMGVWHMNGGFHHGLVIENSGNAPNLSAIATVVWYSRPDKQSELVYSERRSQVLSGGLTMLETRDCVLYCVLITQGGAGEIEITNGKGRMLWKIPSLFRGSFVLEHVFAEGGLVAKVNARGPVDVTVTWLTAAATEVPSS